MSSILLDVFLTFASILAVALFRYATKKDEVTASVKEFFDWSYDVFASALIWIIGSFINTAAQMKAYMGDLFGSIDVAINADSIQLLSIEYHNRFIKDFDLIMLAPVFVGIFILIALVLPTIIRRKGTDSNGSPKLLIGIVIPDIISTAYLFLAVSIFRGR